MNINQLLDTIDRELRDVQTELLENRDVYAKEQRSKPVEVRLRELESVVARLKWELSGIKSTLRLQEMQAQAARGEASSSVPRRPRRQH